MLEERNIRAYEYLKRKDAEKNRAKIEQIIILCILIALLIKIFRR